MDDFHEQPRWSDDWDCHEFVIPKDHYVSEDFAQLEIENVWLRSWQMVCREEQLSTAGEFFVYSLAGMEFLVIRQDDGRVKCFHNVCPHRGAALATGSGRFGGGLIQCPYHAWRWSISGDNIRILDQSEFECGKLRNEDIPLRECRVASWSGWIFINPDPDASSFEDHIAPLASLAAPLEIERMKLRWWRTVRAPANWKIAMQAFQESYHTEASHPQLWQAWVKATGSEQTTQNRDYHIYPNGHGHFGLAAAHSAPANSTTVYGGKSILEGQEAIESFISELHVYAGDIDALLLEDELFVAESLRGKQIPGGPSAGGIGAEFRRSLYETYANKGRFIPSPEALGTAISVTVFPNLIFMPSFGNMLVYRARPLSNLAEGCVFDLFSMRTFAEGEKRNPVKCEEIEIEELPNVFKQDFRNIVRVNRGLKSPAIKSVRLSNRQEVIIRNVHQRLQQLMRG